jgi:hypothetical protein
MQIPSVLSPLKTGMRNCPSLANRAVAALLMAASAFGAAAAPAPSPASLAPVPVVTTPSGNFTDSRTTDAVDFAIVIPAALRLLENDHPTELHPLAGPAAPISALQRVVLVSTLRLGFCMDLRLNSLQHGQAQVADWQVHLAALSGAATASGARIEAFSGGWRVCTRRAGRFVLVLQHAFSLQPFATIKAASTATGHGTALSWPVALSLSTP